MGKYKTYEKYKTLGLDWLGDIPEHWDVRKLKFIASLNMGQSTDSSDYNYDGEGVPFLQGKAEFGSVYPKPFLYTQTAKKFALKDDILLSVRAPVGDLNIADQEYGIGRGLCAIRPLEETYRNFLRYFLEVGKNELLSIATGSTYEAVSISQVANMQCILPPIEEQKQIARFLDRETTRIDTLITKKRQLIDLLQKKRDAIIYEAVTKGIDDQLLISQGVSFDWCWYVPKEWEVVRLKFIAGVQTGLTLGKDYKNRAVVSRPYLRVANVQDGFLDLSEITEIEIPPEDISRYELKPGDVLMTEGGDFDKLGRGYVWEGQIEGCLHQNHVFAVRPHVNYLDSHYLSAIMTSYYGKAYFTSTSQQTTNLATTNSTKLGNFPLPLPSINQQDEILRELDSKLSKLFLVIDKLNEQIGYMQKHKLSLITAAVTGKIDVREEVN